MKLDSSLFSDAGTVLLPSQGPSLTHLCVSLLPISRSLAGREVLLSSCSSSVVRALGQGVHPALPGQSASQGAREPAVSRTAVPRGQCPWPIRGAGGMGTQLAL